MRSTDPAYVEAFNPNHGDGARFIEWSVAFEVVQDEVYETLSVNAPQNTEISRIAQTTDRNHNLLDVGTFEQAGWPLDGSKVIPPRLAELPDAQVGLFMQDMSNANGYFTQPQVYTATTAYPYDLLAITLDWGFSPAVNYTVGWYNGATLLYSEAVTDNTERVNTLNHAVPAVNRVVITITRVRPNSFARLSEFIPGAIIDYSPDNGSILTIEEVVDPFSERAPAGTMRLAAENFAEQFDIFDPSGIYQYFKVRMPLTPVISARSPEGVFKRVRMVTHYLQAPKLQGNLTKLQLEAANLLGSLQDTKYTIGVYKTATLAQFATDVATDAGITVVYPSSFNTISLTAYIPSISHAQAFADIARASCTLLRVTSDDVLTFFAPAGESQITISGEDYRSGDGISPADDDIFNTIELDFQNYTLDTVGQLAKMPATGVVTSSKFYVDNAIITTTTGVYTPKYAPSSNISATITGGELVVTGQKINSTVGTHSTTTRQENERPYTYTPPSSPLIQAQNVQAVAEYALQCKAVKRRVVNINYRGYPFLEVGDIMRFNTGNADTQPFFMTKNRLQLGGGMTGTLEAREL